MDVPSMHRSRSSTRIASKIGYEVPANKVVGSPNEIGDFSNPDAVPSAIALASASRDAQIPATEAQEYDVPLSKDTFPFSL